jgi:hypothetical protein
MSTVAHKYKTTRLTSTCIYDWDVMKASWNEGVNTDFDNYGAYSNFIYGL